MTEPHHEPPSPAPGTTSLELLRAHGAHAVSFHGRFTIESDVPPEG